MFPTCGMPAATAAGFSGNELGVTGYAAPDASLLGRFAIDSLYKLPLIFNATPWVAVPQVSLQG